MVLYHLIEIKGHGGSLKFNSYSSYQEWMNRTVETDGETLEFLRSLDDLERETELRYDLPHGSCKGITTFFSFTAIAEGQLRCPKLRALLANPWTVAELHVDHDARIATLDLYVQLQTERSLQWTKTITLSPFNP